LKSSKYILFIALLGTCIGCSLTKNLKEGQYAVYENELKGIDKTDKEALYGLLEQEPNTRFFGTSIGVAIYRFGERFYDSTKVATSLSESVTELNQIKAALDTLPGDNKLQKRKEKLKEHEKIKDEV
jgi:hypothetical protein